MFLGSPSQSFVYSQTLQVVGPRVYLFRFLFHLHSNFYQIFGELIIALNILKSPRLLSQAHSSLLT